MGGDPLAVVVENASKRFRLYKDRPSSLKERLTSVRPPRSEEFWALQDVSMEIPAGSTFGLIGHNGSGKSTLLRLMAGIHPPTSGRVEVTGRISALLELGAGFHPELTGRENVYLNGAILGLGEREVDAVFDDVVAFAGLEEFIDAPVKIYSSGMYVRLGFSVAVHVEPDVLLVDEVMAVGDEDFQRRCMDHLFELNRSGVTIVMVTHSLGLVEGICDRVALLDRGRVVKEGEPSQVVRSYLEKVDDLEADRLEDEAAEISSDESRRLGTGEIRITDVEFLDDTGQPRELAVTGESFVIRIHYNATKSVEDPVIGMALSREGGVQVFGRNTRYDEVALGTLSGAGHVDYSIAELPVMPGTYALTVSIYDRHVMHPYDVRPDGWSVRVRLGSASQGLGLVDPRGWWRLGDGERRPDA